MKEEVVLIEKTASLVGIMTRPPMTSHIRGLPTILLLNAGILHRAGPNRVYVKIARDLAAAGFPVLRLDFSGIGDSPARRDNLHFEKKWTAEIREVMDSLQETEGTGQYILTGICSGGYIAFKAACCDRRVSGAVLINPQGHLHDYRDEKLNKHISNRVAARHNMRIASSGSFIAKKWTKLVRGEVDIRSLARLLGIEIKRLLSGRREATVRENGAYRDFMLLNERGVRLLNIYSEGDVGLDYLHLLLGSRVEDLRKQKDFRLEMIPGSNHTFTLLSHQKQLMRIIREWALSEFLVHDN